MTDQYTIEVRAVGDGVEIVMHYQPLEGEPLEIGVVVDRSTAREISARIAAAAGDAFHRTSPRPHSQL